MKIIIFLTTICFFSFSSLFGQNDGVRFQRGEHWNYLYTIEGVNFYYQTSLEKDTLASVEKEYVYLKMENTNDEEVLVKWRERLEYKNYSSKENDRIKIGEEKEIHINANESAEGTKAMKILRIFSRFVDFEYNANELNAFSLIEIKIEKLALQK